MEMLRGHKLHEIQVRLSLQDSADDDRLCVWGTADEHTQEGDRASEESGRGITRSPLENLSAQVRDEVHMLCQLRVK